VRKDLQGFAFSLASLASAAYFHSVRALYFIIMKGLYDMAPANRIRSRIFALALLGLAAVSAGMAAEGQWIDLFNSRDLSGWILARETGPNGWKVLADGVVDNKTPSTNIYTEKWFKDFDLHCEFSIYPNSNAGLYLLNRYEIQILDSYNKPLNYSSCGALYTTVAPSVNASKPAGEWQTFDINFRASRFDEKGEKGENGRISVVFNGIKVLDNIELKSPTGAARRYDEEAMGPILIQGDHGPVKFRALRVRGQVYDPPSKEAAGPAVLGVEAAPEKSATNRAEGFALTWHTANHGYAPSFQIYRGESSDFPIDKAHLVARAVRRSGHDFGFEKDGTYSYRVVALGAGGKPGPASDAISVRGKENQAATADLADASWASSEGDNNPSRNKSQGGKPMIMKGRKFEKGIGMRSDSSVVLNVSKLIGNKPHRFQATVGLDDAMTGRRRDVAAARFVVELDGKAVFDSGKMTAQSDPKKVDVAVPAGTRRIALLVKAAGERGQDFSNWAEPRLVPDGVKVGNP
jgi:hypothetical protein